MSTIKNINTEIGCDYILFLVTMKDGITVRVISTCHDEWVVEASNNDHQTEQSALSTCRSMYMAFVDDIAGEE